MDYAAIAMQVVELLKPYALAGGGMVAGGALVKGGEELWEWLKHKCIKPAVAEAVKDASQSPAEGPPWEALKVQLMKALKEDETFRQQLLARLPREVRQQFSAQTIIAAGNEHVNVQGNGRNISIQINRPRQ